jgi:hypothetical protein
MYGILILPLKFDFYEEVEKIQVESENDDNVSFVRNISQIVCNDRTLFSPNFYEKDFY